MPVKQVVIPQIGLVSLYRRRGAKTIRLSIKHDGEIRVTLPSWTPYSAGIVFLRKNVSWIEKNKIQNTRLLTDNLRIGKYHTLIFFKNPSLKTISSKVTENEIKITFPAQHEITSDEVQLAAKLAAHRALKSEASKLLPQKLEILARQHGFLYNQVKIRQLKSRWGSCNNLKQITLNYYLIQLPWELIDYVILHELTHTKVLAHGKNFWEELTMHLPNAKVLRKQINTYKPILVLYE